jgi:hypothetical protein
MKSPTENDGLGEYDLSDEDLDGAAGGGDAPVKSASNEPC